MTRFCILALALTLVACGGSSPTAPSAPVTAASLTVSASPNPIIAGAGYSIYPYSAVFTLTVAESAGMGANINYVNVTLRNATTGVELNTINFSATDIINKAGSNHVAGRGTLTVPNMGMYYSLSYGGRQATMTIAVQMQDDAGHTTNQVLTVPVV